MAYPTKRSLELPEMHKKRIAWKFGKTEYSECSEMHFEKLPL